MNGKSNIYNIINNIKGIESLKIEAYIKETKQRPDLLFDYKGQKYAIEFQCTPINVEELDDRHNLYKLVNVKDIWIFGRNKYSKIKGYNCLTSYKKKSCEMLFENLLTLTSSGKLVKIFNLNIADTMIKETNIIDVVEQYDDFLPKLKINTFHLREKARQREAMRLAEIKHREEMDKEVSDYINKTGRYSPDYYKEDEYGV